MVKANACIFLISARDTLIRKCLQCLDDNYNRSLNYPVLVFYHGTRYDSSEVRGSIRSINPKTAYTFHNLEYRVPDGLTDKDMFWNLPRNAYAKRFGASRIGYLHANYFWNNFMNVPELRNYDYMMRIDDDSWFKAPIGCDLFEELERRSGQFGTAYVWNTVSRNTIDTRYRLFEWIKEYTSKNNITITNSQLRDSLEDSPNNHQFHSLSWNCGNCNVYNCAMFKTEEWKMYNDAFNQIAGGYRYRWGDIEVIGLFAYIYLDNPLVDFDLRSKGMYEPQLPGTTFVRNAVDH